MGLLSTEAEISLFGSNIPYYENLGYFIPREKRKGKKGYYLALSSKKLLVSVEHLKGHSNAFVDVECDICEKQYKMRYSTYNLQNHNGKIYCKTCSNKLKKYKEKNK